MFFALPVKAQVKIGENSSPAPFSILELVSKNSGLRLPQLTTEERDNVATQWKAPNADPDVVKAAEGLVIYNKTNNCLEFWNGEDWISLCAGAEVDRNTETYPVLNASYDFPGSPEPTISNLTAATGDNNVQWYSAETGGNLLDNSTKLTNGGTYYAVQKVGTCTNPERVPVKVTISTPPLPAPS